MQIPAIQDINSALRLFHKNANLAAVMLHCRWINISQIPKRGVLPKKIKCGELAKIKFAPISCFQLLKPFVFHSAFVGGLYDFPKRMSFGNLHFCNNSFETESFSF